MRTPPRARRQVHVSTCTPTESSSGRRNLPRYLHPYACDDPFDTIPQRYKLATSPVSYPIPPRAEEPGWPRVLISMSCHGQFQPHTTCVQLHKLAHEVRIALRTLVRHAAQGRPHAARRPCELSTPVSRIRRISRGPYTAWPPTRRTRGFNGARPEPASRHPARTRASLPSRSDL